MDTEPKDSSICTKMLSNQLNKTVVFNEQPDGKNLHNLTAKKAHKDNLKKNQNLKAQGSLSPTRSAVLD